MLRSCMLLLFTTLLAVAAPVPKQTEKEKIAKKFGTITDPKGDSKFALDGDALKVTLPADEERRFGYTKDPAEKSGLKRFDHTPRVEFPHAGDFDLRVRVAFPLVADTEAVDGREFRYAGGGVKVVNSEGNLYWFGVVRSTALLRTNTLLRDGSPGTWSNDFRDTLLYEPLKSQESAWLRVVRKGDGLTCDASTDGKEWKNVSEHYKAAPGEGVTLSLYAEHSSTKAHTVTFDQFTVEKPKAEKK